PRLAANDSPVPAYMMLGFVGSITMVDTARLAMKSFTGCQMPPPSVECHIPPLALPIHMLFVLLGSITIVRIRPPTLPAPNHVQSLGWRVATESPSGFPAALALSS